MVCISADNHTAQEDQTFTLFDCFNPQTYNTDVDPDLNIFSSSDISKLCNYYDEPQFNELCSLMPANMFSSFHLNIRSLPCNYDSFLHYLSSLKHDFSVMALTETWLTEDSKEIYKLPNYNSAHHVRKNRKGGGVSLFVRSDYDFKTRDDLSMGTGMSEMESMFIELQVTGEKNIIVGAIYRPPDSVTNDFIEGLLCLLDRVNYEKKYCFILGDFNLNLLKYKSDTHVEDYLNVLYSTFFYPLIHKATRVKETTATLIDNILSNSLSNCLRSGVLYCDVSDHLPIFQFSNIKTTKTGTNKDKITKRIINGKNISKFKNKLDTTSWVNLYEEKDTQHAYLKFMEIFNSYFEECFPVKNFTKKHDPDFNKPWFSPHLLKLLKKKNKLYQRYVSNPTPLNRNAYKCHRNIYNHATRSAKHKHFEEEFGRCTNNSKYIWKVINQLLQRENSTPKLPSVFISDGESIENPFNIAEKFNEFFVNIGLNLANNIPHCDANPLDSIKGTFSIISTFDPPDSQEISDIIESLKSSAAGHDNIPASLVKQVKSSILEPLRHVFSLSLKTGVIPHELKIAKVIPLFKMDNPGCFSNYRPISILPCFSKILEKIVYKRIISHLNSNEILYKHQYGFRKNHSTCMALIHLVDKIISAQEKGDFVCSIFLDFSKAFDTIDHSILLAKLHKYGIHMDAHKWLTNYISHRTQFVCIKGCFSNKAQLHCGVPQGSILGPLLFLIYINDLCNISKIFSPIMFADDTTLVLSNSNFESLIRDANNGLGAFVKWFKINKLSLNIKKSNFIIFSGKKVYNKDLSKIEIESIQMPQVASTRFLGIIIDESLSWREQIFDVCRKVSKSIGIIRRVRNLISKKCLLTLYYSLIYPYLSYCNIVWGSTFTTSLQKIKILQNRFVRLATRSVWDATSAPLFLQLQILNIYDINKYLICLFMYQIFSIGLNVPDHFKSYFAANSQFHSYSTRQAQALHPPKYLKSRSQFLLKYQGVKVWNRYSYIASNCRSLAIFKKHLRESLLKGCC